MALPFRKVQTLLFALTWCGGVLAGPLHSQAPPEITAFIHVNVVPMDRQHVSMNQTVIVIDDRIQEVGASEDVRVPSGARVVDGVGKFLMPGLVDMHMHLWYEGDLLLYVANGVTTVRSLFGGPTHLEWREHIKRGERLGPTIYTSGPIIDGEPPYFPESVVATTPQAAREIVAEQAEAGYDFVKVLNGVTREVYDALREAAREHGLPVVGHVPTAVGLQHVLESRQASIEHMDGIGLAASTARGSRTDTTESHNGLLGGWADLDETRLAKIAEQIREAGTWICPTLLAGMEFNLPKHITARIKAPEMRYVHPSVLEFWRQITHDSASVQLARRAEPGRKHALKVLSSAGVPILLGTDSPNELIVPGFSILQELRELVDAGLTPYEAIKAGTSGAATFLGGASEFGSVTKGKRADLILIDGNPLADVENVGKRAGVMVRGVWHPMADLQSRLEELAQHYASDSAAAKTANR